MTKMMRGVYFLEPGKLEMREVPVPEPGPGEVVLQVESATTCGTDLKAYRRGHKLFKPPMPFGHEYAGYITAVGSGVKHFREGDAVMGTNSAPCNECFYCRRGRQQLCVELEGRFNFGTYAEYVKVPAYIVAQTLHKKPDHLPFTEASFIEPLACAVLCAIYTEVNLGDTVAIIGVGAQGLMQIQLMKAMGASRVIAIGRAKGRLERAKQVGADDLFSSLDGDPVAYVKELTAGHGADVVIEAAGTAETWSQAMMMTRKGGMVVQFSGLPGGTQVSFDATHLHYGEITMKGIFHTTPRAVEQAALMLSTGTVSVKPILDGVVPLSQVEDSLLKMQRSEVIKVAVVPSMAEEGSA
jgi:L-iditol 2-dehydrogenase